MRVSGASSAEIITGVRHVTLAWELGGNGGMGNELSNLSK